jgi:hypothetical protein
LEIWFKNSPKNEMVSDPSESSESEFPKSRKFAPFSRFIWLFVSGIEGSGVGDRLLQYIFFLGLFFIDSASDDFRFLESLAVVWLRKLCWSI